MRIDQLQAQLPKPKKADPNAAAALQELLGGNFGEMSTLNNYMVQSFDFLNKEELRRSTVCSPALSQKSWATSSGSPTV